MSVVYFIQAGDGGPIKIGVTANVERRLVHLQAGCPDQLTILATVEGDPALETRLHWALARHRHRGEWFRPTPEVLEAVAEAKNGLEYRAKFAARAEQITGAERLLADIEQFCICSGIPESTVGRKALGDWKFVKELRSGRGGKPRRIWPETESKVRSFMAAYAPQDAEREATAA